MLRLFHIMIQNVSPSRPKAERHELLRDERFGIERTEAMLRVSKFYVPKECSDIFSLVTKDRFQDGGKTIEKGSYLIIDPEDRYIRNGRLMIFFINGIFDMRRCNVGELVWLERLSDPKLPPIILTREDAFNACMGFVYKIIPLPKFLTPQSHD